MRRDYHALTTGFACLQLDRKANSLLDINHIPLVPQITSELPPFILISFCCKHIAVAQPTNVATYSIPGEPSQQLRLDPTAGRDPMVLSFQPTSSYTPHLFRRNVHNHEAADALPRVYWQVCPTVGAYRKPPPPHPHAPSPPMSTDPACHRFTKGLIFHWLHFGEFLGHTFARCSSPGSTCEYTIPMPHTISASSMSPSHHRLALGLSNGSIFIICAHSIVTQIISPCIAKGILSLAFAHDNLVHLASGDGAIGVFTPTAEGRTNFGGHKSVHVLGSHPARVRKIISASRTGTLVELSNGRICVLDVGKAAATSSGVLVQAALDVPRRMCDPHLLLSHLHPQACASVAPPTFFSAPPEYTSTRSSCSQQFPACSTLSEAVLVGPTHLDMLTSKSTNLPTFYPIHADYPCCRD